MQRCSRHILQWLALAAFVISLLFSPALNLHTLLCFGVASAQSRDAGDMVTVGKNGLSPAAAYAASPDTKPAEGKEKIIDFFKMGMAALAGLVLFIYGVTQLAEGLGETNSERMRR